MACECELSNTLDVDVTQDALLDVEIGGSAGVLLQAKSVDVTTNGTSVVAPDDGFDGLKSVEINTNVPKRFECGDATFAHPAIGATSINLIGLLQKLNASCWDTSKVTDMSRMFWACELLTTLDVSVWDTSKVTTMNGMFSGCSKLTTLDVSNFDTSKVKNMRQMFGYCYSLTTLDMSGWDTSEVTDMGNMFVRCYVLKSIIGDKSLEDVENGIIALKGTKVSLGFSQSSELRYSSMLALAKGLADLTGQTAQTISFNTTAWNNMRNDDNTIPTSDVIAERQARLSAIAAQKNWNIAH